MDASVLAIVVGAVVAGGGGFFVPALIARIPEVEPELQAEPEPQPVLEAPPEHLPDEHDASVTAEAAVRDPEPPPEPFAEIASISGLGWRSALAAAIAGAIIGAAVGWEWALVLLVPLVPVSVALAVVDWRTRLLPTAVIRPTYGVLVALVLVGWLVTHDTDAVIRSALGWLVMGGFFAVFWFIYPRGLGFGDVRLAGVLGIVLGWVGWGALLVGLYSGFLFGGVIGGLLSVLKIVERKGFPFGPFMLVGALFGIVWGGQILGSLVP